MRVEPVRVDQVPKWIWLVMLALGIFSFLFNNKYRTRIWRTVRFPGSSGWPLVPATVEQGIVHTYPVWGLKLPGRSQSYRAEIIYSYSVDGEYYSGWYEGDFLWSKHEADDFVAQYPKGTTIQVHVSSAKPELSVLRL